MALSPSGYDRERCLELACAIEGHPDNVAPAIMGGLVSSFVEGDDTTSIRMEIAPNLRFVAVAPPYEVRTADARRVLPTEVPTSTAVWQMGRCVAVVRALETGDAALLGKASHDRLHEPYRAKLIPDYEPLRACALAAGAASCAPASGSTPYPPTPSAPPSRCTSDEGRFSAGTSRLTINAPHVGRPFVY